MDKGVAVLPRAAGLLRAKSGVITHRDGRKVNKVDQMGLSGKAGHLTAAAYAGAAVLLLPAAASVSCVIRGLAPFDTPFESPQTADNSHALAAAAPALTRTVHRLELKTPPRRRPVRHRHLRPRAELHPVQRQGGAADRRLPRQRAGPRRWPRCGPASAAATCGYSCCRCHRRARTRGCGGSSHTAPGSPRPRTAARSRARTSSAHPAPARRPSGQPPRALVAVHDDLGAGRQRGLHPGFAGQP
jgi:hypothetical protein